MNKNIFKTAIVSVMTVFIGSLLMTSCAKKNFSLNGSVPVASFTVNQLTPTSDSNSANLQLINTSTNSMTAYWVIVNDSGQVVGSYVGDTQKVAIVFAGDYTVKMAAGGPGGLSDTIQQTVTIAQDNPYAIGPTTLLGILTGAAFGNTQRTWIPMRVVNSVIVWDNYQDCLGQINGTNGGAWWAFGTPEITPGTGRDGYLDDQYTFTFGNPGQFIFNDNNTIYLDAGGSNWTGALPAPWNNYLGTYASTRDSTITTSSQVLAATNTPTPVSTAVFSIAPEFKPWGSGTFSYALANAPAGAMQLGTITVNGAGAHLGLPDKTAGGDETNSITTTSNTYDVLQMTTGLKDSTTGVLYDELIVGMQESGVVWTFMFQSNE